MIMSYSNQYIFIIREIWLNYGRWTNFGRPKVKDHTMTFYNFLCLQFQRYGTDKIFKFKFTA